MGNHPLFVFLLATFAVFGLAREAVPTTNTSYIVGTSDALIPGSELVIGLNLLDLISTVQEGTEREDEECVLDLRVTSDGLLWHRSGWKIDVDAVPKSFHKTLSLLVPPDESKLGETTELRIESHSCFKFSRSVEVPVAKKDLLVSVRTDKSKYHPGEYVLIEWLVLTHELRPHLMPVNLSVHNSRNEVLVRWLNVTAEEGLIREQYYLPRLAREEELTVTLESHEQQVNYTLEVELPSSPYGKETFEVDVRSPRYLTVTAPVDGKGSSLDVNVVASFESGVPVQGNVELQLSLVGETNLKPLPAYKLEAGHKLVSLELEEVKILLGMKKEDSLVGRTVEVHVTVEEDRPSVEKEREDEKKDEESKKEEKKEEEGKDEEKKGEEMKEEDGKEEDGKEEEKGESKVEERSELESNETKKESERDGMEEDKDREERDGMGEGRDREEKEKRRPAHSVTRVVNVTFVDQSHVLFFSEFTPLYFKPGLSYTGQVLLKPVDESLPTESEEKEVTLKVKHYSSHSESPREEELKLKLKSNSIGEFSVKVPWEDTRLELEATFDDKEAGKVTTAHLKELLPFGSQDGYYLQVSLEQKPPKVEVGESLKVKVESTFPTDEFLYEVLCQSLLVLSGKVTLASPSTSHELSLSIPRNVSHLLSSPRLVVLALTPSNELVSDSLRFVVEDEEEEPLELELKSEVAKPGDTVELLVKAEPYTRVYMLTTSDLLVYEPKEQELRKLDAHQRMVRYLRYLNSSQFTETIEDLCETCSTVPSLAPDSLRVFNESSGLLLTDGVLFTDSNKPWPPTPVKNGTWDDLEYPRFESLVEFETRFWHLNVTVGPSGEEKLTFVVPEEGRLYTLAAYGLRPGKGLVVSEEPVQLLVTSKLLVELGHPESVVRGEELQLEVHLFNNQDKEVEVNVELKKGPGYELPCMKEESKDEGLEVKVNLKPKETKVVPFPVKTSPTGQEPLEIEVEVKSEDVHLNLNTTLNVEYQGYEVQHQNSSVLDNFNGEEVLVLDLTKRVSNPIEKSERALVKLYGHPLGSAIEHACRDLNESSILERTKLLFVLGVNVLEHIANNSLFDNSVHVEYDDEELLVDGTFGVPVDKDECIESVRDALEYLLEKENPDGSVSFYPSGPGYIWLTTLLLDANLLLKNVRWTDEEKVLEKVEWLLKQQKSDGSFTEDENAVLLRHPWATKSHVPLTSQVAVSLLEVLEELELPKATAEQVEASTEKALDFVLEEVTGGKLDNDSYSLNLAAYALALARNEKVFEVLVKRDRLVKHEDELSFWSVELEEELKEEQNSLIVEATSYGVLTYLALNDLLGAGPFVEFLMSRMKPEGTFVSTLDTNVALRALSEYYRNLDTYYQHEQVNVEANVTLNGKETVTLRILDPLFVGELYFDSSNLTLGGPLKVESSGVGLLLVQSDVKYNQAVPSFGPSEFDLTLEEHPKDPEHLELKVCAVNLKKEESTFLVGEVPLLSGYELNVDEVKSSPDLQVLKQDDLVYLVFNKVENLTPKCVELELEKLHPVGSLEPRFVRLYPVNDPDVSIYKPYSVLPPNEMERTCPK